MIGGGTRHMLPYLSGVPYLNVLTGPLFKTTVSILCLYCSLGSSSNSAFISLALLLKCIASHPYYRLFASKLPITRNFLDFLERFELSGVDCNKKNTTSLLPLVLKTMGLYRVFQKFVPIVNCILRKAFNASLSKCKLI